MPIEKSDTQESSSTGAKKQKSLDLLKTQFRENIHNEKNEIQHTNMEISKTAQLRDIAKKAVGLKASKHTPERVNRQVDQFKDALKKIGNKSDSLDYLPKDLMSLFMEVATSLPGKFKSACENAVNNYDSSNPLSRLYKHKERHNAQDSLEELNAQLKDMAKVLDGWRYMTTVKDMRIRLLSDNPEASKLEIVDSRLEKAKEECIKVLERYKAGNAQQDESKPFQDILDWFKKPAERWEGQTTAPNLNKYLAEFFKNQFIFHLIERDIAPADLLSSIHRQMTTIEVGTKYGKDAAIAFAIAKGKTIEEKSKRILYKDTTKDFANRYYIYRKAQNILADVKGYKSILPYKYNIKRYKNTLDILYAFRHEDERSKIKDTNRLPHSEITYHVLSTNNFFNIKQIVHREVINKDTQFTCTLFKHNPDHHTYIFKKGTDGYYAMLGTENCLGTVFLLNQHKDKFRKKEINKIKWKKQDLKLFIGNNI